VKIEKERGNFINPFSLVPFCMGNGFSFIRSNFINPFSFVPLFNLSERGNKKGGVTNFPLFTLN